MKSGSLMMLLAASLAAAQDPLAQIPDCAKDCVTKSMMGPGTKCSPTDVACTCSDENFLNNIACCLVDVCKKEDQEKTVQVAKTLCSSFKVQVPDKVECKKAAAPSASSTHSSSTTATSASAASTSTAAAAPMLVGTGSLAGAVVAMLAAL